jgi:histone-lysine N-methyltransferase SETMAR
MAAKLTECSNLEQRAVIRFLQAEGVKTTQIYSRMKAQYGCNCLSKSSCYEWTKAFKEGRVEIQDDERSGRPVDISTPETIRNIEQLILADRRVKIDDIAERLGVSHGSVHKIVHEMLGFNKVSARWVPKMLTDVHKEQRLLAARCGLARFRREGDNFLNRIVTTDETWVFHYEPETKRQSLEWKRVTSSVKKKFKSQRATRKVMLTVFWDMQGPITLDFKSQGTTVNSANYCELLGKVKEDIRNKRRGLQSKGVIFHQDNA